MTAHCINASVVPSITTAYCSKPSLLSSMTGHSTNRSAASQCLTTAVVPSMPTHSSKPSVAPQCLPTLPNCQLHLNAYLLFQTASCTSMPTHSSKLPVAPHQRCPLFHSINCTINNHLLSQVDQMHHNDCFELLSGTHINSYLHC